MSRSRPSRRFVERAGPPLASLLIRGLRMTLRLRTHNRELVESYAREGKRYVHVFWHAHLLLMVYSYVGPRLAFMISQHRDGQLIADTVTRFGYRPIRGSTTRGGAMAMRGLMRALEQGDDIGFTPDGPRGPAREVQQGAVAAARWLKLPIVPIALGTTSCWRLNTWDRFVIPKPGARVLMAYGEPFHVEPDEPLERAAQRLTDVLVDLEKFAEDNAGDPGVGRALSRWIKPQGSR